jgi:hypothetical protein
MFVFPFFYETFLSFLLLLSPGVISNTRNDAVKGMCAL